MIPRSRENAVNEEKAFASLPNRINRDDFQRHFARQSETTISLSYQHIAGSIVTSSHIRFFNQQTANTFAKSVHSGAMNAV